MHREMVTDERRSRNIVNKAPEERGRSDDFEKNGRVYVKRASAGRRRGREDLKESKTNREREAKMDVEALGVNVEYPSGQRRVYF